MHTLRQYSRDYQHHSEQVSSCLLMINVAALAKFSKSTQVAKLLPGFNDTLALESVDFKLDQLWFRS